MDTKLKNSNGKCKLSQSFENAPIVSKLLENPEILEQLELIFEDALSYHNLVEDWVTHFNYNEFIFPKNQLNNMLTNARRLRFLFAEAEKAKNAA